LQKYAISANFHQKRSVTFKPNLYSLEMCGLIDSTVYFEHQFDADTY